MSVYVVCHRLFEVAETITAKDPEDRDWWQRLEAREKKVLCTEKMFCWWIY